MSSYLLVTTFNQQGYDLYGKTMLASFLTHWPKDQRIMVYTENVNLDPELAKNSRILTKDLNQVRDLVLFKKRHENNQKAHGFWPEGNTVKQFQYDGVRFSHKVFALYDCWNNSPVDYKSMVWLDADTLTFRDIPDNFLETVAPRSYTTRDGAKEKFGICYLGRIKQHSECGFVSYNKMHPLMHMFWENFIDLYKNDSMFQLKEWHDSFLFDHARVQFEAKGMKNLNLTPKFMTGHPFINCVLGEYMDHMKGSRKKQGRSRKGERHVRSTNEPDWWK